VNKTTNSQAKLGWREWLPWQELFFLKFSACFSTHDAFFMLFVVNRMQLIGVRVNQN
jgi:hypothetical protein